MERDPIAVITRTNLVISTHTLTWSVTLYGTSNYIDRYISTHTLTWSVTIGVFLYAGINIDFNSHAHVERDD